MAPEAPTSGLPSRRRQEFAWAFYDWANSAYATAVLAGFFPIFFRNYWSVGQESSAITFNLGVANSASSVLIILLAPLLGAIADRCRARKRFLLIFTVLGVTMTVALFYVAQGEWLVAAMVYVLATTGFLGSIVFYDALMISVTSRENYDRVSALGYALGYLGGGLSFLLCVLMTLFPGHFGLADEAAAVRVSFLLVAVWWGVFCLPLVFMVREERTHSDEGAAVAIRAGLQRVMRTLGEIRRMRAVAIFLLAYWLYIDGVDTIVRMAVDYGMALGFSSNDLIVALLITQFVGFPAALAFGRMAGVVGARRGILIAIGVYILVTVWGASIQQPWEFYTLAVMIGLVQGGIQSLSRAYYGRLVPPERAAEFFGFYNVMGKFAAVIGPVMVGWVGALSGSPRIGLMSIIVLFVAGALLLMRVDEEEVSSRESS